MNDKPMRPDPAIAINPGPAPEEKAAPLGGAALVAGESASRMEDFADRLLDAQIVSNDQPLNLRHVGGARFLVQVALTFMILGYCGWQLARDKNPDKTLYATTGTVVLGWWISSPGRR